MRRIPYPHRGVGPLALLRIGGWLIGGVLLTLFITLPVMVVSIMFGLLILQYVALAIVIGAIPVWLAVTIYMEVTGEGQHKPWTPEEEQALIDSWENYWGDK